MTGPSEIVSVIIPCYNYGHLIAETIGSLQQQTLADWRCYVIDDGSLDDTAIVVANLAGRDKRIKYIYQENKGQPAARNAGLAVATGQFIQFLDADDLLQPDKFRNQVNYLQQHPEVDIVYGDVRYFETGDLQNSFVSRWGNDRTLEWMPRISGRGEMMIESLVDINIFELGCALFRRTAIESAGRFNEKLTGVEDYAYLFTASVRSQSFAYLNSENTCVLMRHHPASFSKRLAHMYEKELQLRILMNDELKKAGNEGLMAFNGEKYDMRLRKLQHFIIDRLRKGDRASVNFKNISWVYSHSSLKQNLYFLPRLVKSFLTFRKYK